MCVFLGRILRVVLDTKYYGKVSKAIYRYRHLNTTDSFNGAHTTSEGEHTCFIRVFSPFQNLVAMNAEGYIEMIRFYSRFILNVDEATLN